MNRRSFVIVMVCFAVASLSVVAWFVYKKTTSQLEAAQPVAIDQTVLHQQWQTKITQLLEEFKQQQNPQKTKLDLLAMRVAKPDLETHLALVLAMESIINKEPEAQQKLENAKQLLETKNQ